MKHALNRLVQEQGASKLFAHHHQLATIRISALRLVMYQTAVKDVLNPTVAFVVITRVVRFRTPALKPPSQDVDPQLLLALSSPLVKTLIVVLNHALLRQLEEMSLKVFVLRAVNSPSVMPQTFAQSPTVQHVAARHPPAQLVKTLVPALIRVTLLISVMESPKMTVPCVEPTPRALSLMCALRQQSLTMAHQKLFHALHHQPVPTRMLVSKDVKPRP